MASGHMNRVKRPDTWLHRPMLQNVKKVLANPEPSTHDPQQMRWMAPAHGIWVPKCEGPKAFTSKIGAIRYADYHDRPRLGQERFSSSRC
jgi:hypothetical protein